MFILYDLIFFIFILFSIPYICIKQKFHKDVFRRFYLSIEVINKLKGKNPIWVHAVSVGEVMAVRKFIEGLKKDTDKLIILSTVTSTGNKLAKDILGKQALVIYLPVDISFIVRRFIRVIRPSIFIAVETEIWPNLTQELSKNNIPIVVINGRISDNSFKGYKFIRILLKNILKKISIFCMQSELYANRIISLGAEKDRVKITGNMKFDNIDYSAIDSHAVALGMIKPQDPLFIAGSTHKGEEEIILRVYKNLLNSYPDLQLIIAPRHIERTPEIERLIEKFGFICIRMSRRQSVSASRPVVFILDTIGILSSLYGIATVVFIGGSLAEKGGHNIIEPAIFGKPIIFGPSMYNFRDINELFLREGAAVLVKNANELESAAKELLRDSHKREVLGSKAKIIITENRGTTDKNLAIVKDILSTNSCK